MQRFDHETYCVIPWHSVYIAPNGDYRLCCRSYQEKKDNQGNTLNFTQHSLNEIWLGDSLKQVREQLQSQQKISACDTCIKEEANGMFFGKRSKENTKYYNRYRNLELHAQPRYLGIALGSQCNLKCRTCNSGYSSFFRKEMTELLAQNPKNAENYSKKLTDIHALYESEPKDSWLNRSNLIEEIDFSQLDELYLLGGEPFLIPQLATILENCISVGNIGLRIRINTNMTYVPDSLCDLIGEFTDLQIIGSVDGVGKIGEYIRYPSKWNKVSDNAKKIAASLQPTSQFVIQSTLSIYNILYLEPIYDWYLKLFEEFPKSRLFHHVNLVHEPPYQNICHLPLELKQRLKCEYESFVPRIENPDIRVQFKETLDYLLSRPQDEALYQQFMRSTNMMDRYRKQKFLEVCPEFSEFFDSKIGVDE